MEAAKKRILARKRNKAHVRKKINGTPEILRVSVFRSSKHIYGQAVDDKSAKTICSVSTLEKDVKEKIEGHTGNVTTAKMVGKILGEKLSAKGHEKIVFDRNGYLYHGRIRGFADGIREAGIKF